MRTGCVRALPRLLLGLALGAPFPAAGHDEPVPEAPSPYARRASHGAPVRTSRYVTMRDGVRLAIDLILPADLVPGERIPAVLHHGRYWRSVELRGAAGLFYDSVDRQSRLGPFKDHFVRRGYAWIDVDGRGSGASFGHRTWEYSPQEILDGGDLVDWIVAQPWSDGRVATTGVSYSGGLAELTLLNQRAAVRVAAPLFCEFDQYRDILAPGGVPHRAWLSEWGDFTRRMDRGEVPVDALAARLFVRGVRPAGPRGEAELEAAVRDHGSNWDFSTTQRVTFRDDTPLRPADARTRARRDARAEAFAWLEARFGRDFLARGTDLASSHAYAAELDAAGVPHYAVSGWLDGAYARAAIDRHLSLSHPDRKLLLGPWDHAFTHVSPHAPVTRSHFDLGGELLRFVDAHVRGDETGIEDEAPVHYFTLGAERWRSAPSWPPPATRVSWFLDAGATLTRGRPVTPGTDVYEVNFAAGTGRQSRWSALDGRPLRAPYSDRAARDARLLVYTSEPLEAPLEVTGHGLVTLHVASSAEDGAFHAYLEDVAPDGSVAYVTEGLLRALHRRYREPPPDDPLGLPLRSFLRADAEPLVPGEVAELRFPLLPISYRFAEGHRIRLALAGADTDHFARIPETGPATWHLHRGPSHILLPVAN